MIYGDGGNDKLFGEAGIDLLIGGAGDDYVVGGAEGDTLYCELGNDFLGGQEGDDRLFAGEGDDVIYADDGRDLILGGGGRDVLHGGRDSDRFIFSVVGESTVLAPDRVNDFERGLDQIDLAGIDADLTVAGDQAFAFVTAFSGQRGHAVLAYDAAANLTRLSLDQNGDAQADMLVEIVGQVGVGDGFLL